ncbi:uncharacterized protein DDB_G0283357-like [Ischnura elegans]|uniref:uncharacterized protein DDB_G0283357-like n=1 Tax=Ischnura elegans TaxID=197161 RepID=UPI001ED86A90|nr:uncharacterized protein DDB_G0283357-like [Ischnura elegans]
MDPNYIKFSDGSPPLFSIDRSGENKIRSHKSRGRGNYFSPYKNSPHGGHNSSSPGHSSGQDSPDFIPFGYSSPNNSFGSGRGRGQWNRGQGNRRYNNNNGGQGGYKGSMSPFQSNRGKFSSPYRGKRGDNKYHGNAADISLYYHHSMVEDPWAELEEKLNLSSPKPDCKRVSDGNKIDPVGSSQSDSDSAPSCVNLTCGSQGDESVDSGSDNSSS